VSGRHPDWAALGPSWPNSAASQFIEADGYRWHVQRTGTGPACLLLHGTGAATHSWRDVLPLLAAHYDVIAIDLPGHGFTRSVPSRRVSLPGMAASLAALLDGIGVTPDLMVGHSAGAAIAMQLALYRGWRMPIVGFTPALMPFPGLAAKLFPSLARVLFTNPFTAIIFSRIAGTRGETERFLKRATASEIDAVGLRCYEALFRTSGHCDGAIRMMANWQLEPLRDRLGAIAAPVLLISGERDPAIPHQAVFDAAARIPGASVQQMAACGHLAHEEDPAQAAAIVIGFAAAHDGQPAKEARDG
jgi:magnesium chelatase accessory protein